MMNVRKFYRDILCITDNEIAEQLEASTRVLKINRGELLIRQGERQEDFSFLVSGIFRGFYFDALGRDTTDCFGFKKGTPCMSIAINNGISPINIEAVTPCEFIQIPGSQLIPLIERNPTLLRIYNNILQTALQIHWDLKVVVTQQTALERYKWFVKNYADLIDRVNDKDIASYLGMTAVTLSRIKKIERENRRES